MVRLEKALYEKLVNTAVLGRARTIATPKKWMQHNPEDYKAVQAAYMEDNSFLHKVYDKILYPFYRRFWWQWQRDIALQRGLAMDDFYMYGEHRLRRSPLYENVFRDGCHPYQYLLYKYRRNRYYKVERVCQGFFVPDHLREEVKNRTWAETLRARWDWTNFMYRNYMSDLTPSGHDTKGKMSLLEIFNQYGPFRCEAWERMFYNEQEYDYIDAEDYEKYTVRPGGCDLETTEGRSQFENKINTLIQDFPGLIVPEGNSFDFETFFMKWSLVHGKDTSRFDQSRLDSVYNDVRDKIEGRNATPLELTGSDAKVGRSVLGTEFPAGFTEQNRRAIMN